MDILFNAFSCAILLSGLVDLRCKEAERCFSFGLVRLLFLLPLMSAGYLYLNSNMQTLSAAPFFFTEIVFSLTWTLLAYSLKFIIEPTADQTAYKTAQIAAICGASCIGLYWMIRSPNHTIADNAVILPMHGHLFFSSLLLLIAALMMAWRTETFWRGLHLKDRRSYKYLVIGFFLISASLAWSSSFRLTYQRISSDHLVLLAILLVVAWLLIVFDAARNRLLNRKIFVSRKVVYSSVVPIAFGCYLSIIGVISLLMRTFGWSLNNILEWLLIIAGILLIAALALSAETRDRVKYFISTHFYVNKYEYRDEWLAFSDLLHRKFTESGVVEALRQILLDSLYTDTVKIWLGSTATGFRLTDAHDAMPGNQGDLLSPDDPLIRYLLENPFLDRSASITDSTRQAVIDRSNNFFDAHRLELIAPLAIGGQCVGLIGIGSEFTGGRYGSDDYDLLAALGSQAAAALIAVRAAEELARFREQSAWDTLSRFVLHDIKNAAAMLSMVKGNAADHIHIPEFQQDILEAIDDALKRMEKVQARLKALQGEMVPLLVELDAGSFIHDCCARLAGKLPALTVNLQCRQAQPIHTDPEFMAVIVENLLLNAMEASGSNRTRIQILISDTRDQELQLEFLDNGPGIEPEMLPNRIFEPFVSAKPKGSGIGLWQVRCLIETLGGKIEARNVEGQGALFIIRLPRLL